MLVYTSVCVGTPPRIDGRTVKYAFLEKQCGDNPPTPFSFLNLRKGLEVHNTYVTLCIVFVSSSTLIKSTSKGVYVKDHFKTTGPF